jgi:uncharacterized membrane protein
MAEQSTRSERDDRGSTADRGSSGGSNNKALIGAGIAVAAVGAAGFLLARRSPDVHDDGQNVSDAPDHTWRRKTGRYEEGLVGRTVTINKPREELYHAWRDFTKFPSFMENVDAVEDLGDGRSKWTIKAPLGSSVDVITRITDDRPGEAIGWKSEPDSQIETEGRVEFIDIAPGRGTGVRLTMHYTPPAGLPGRAMAKFLQREPNLQARRDLRRFKMLQETGEIATNASPSARKSETPTQAKI